MNSRYPVAIHILTLLAYAGSERMTSEHIACSVTTNPVVIRRVLGDLRRAGLVTARTGSGGGWQLRKGPEQITLLDAYHAVQDGLLFAMPPQKPNPECAIGKTIQQTLAGFFAGAETALETHLAQSTVADVLARVQASAFCPFNAQAANTSEGAAPATDAP